MTFVKVCSVRAVEHAVWAREAGADEIGMIFANAPRRIDLKVARAVRRELGPRVEIAEATTETVERERHAADQPLLVGVFAGQSSGGYVMGAYEVALGIEEGRVVTILNDIGERYFSTGMWD